MKAHRRLRRLLMVVACALACGFTVMTPPFGPLRGQSIDLLFFARSLLPAGKTDSPPPVAIVALDEVTARQPPFNQHLMDFWRDPIAEIVSALTESGATVIGLDLVFAHSTEAYVEGSESSLLQAVGTAAEKGKIVLAESQTADNEARPHEWLAWVAGFDENIRSVNIREDNGVIREIPLFFQYTDGATRPAFGLELAARALGVTANRAPDGAALLAGRQVPENTLINYLGTGDAIPTYSLAEIWRCARTGTLAPLQAHFAGKVVIVGVIMGLLDHKLTSLRHVGGRAARQRIGGCPEIDNEPQFVPAPNRTTIPGVYIQANAVANLIEGKHLVPSPAGLDMPIVLAISLLLAFPALLLPPRRAAAALALLSAGYAGLVLIGFLNLWLLPFLRPLLAGGTAFIFLFGIRVSVLDRQHRKTREAFQTILPESQVERLIDEGVPLRLGGEIRTLTVWISDLADYSSYAEAMQPEELVQLLNRVYGAMAEEIERHNGFVMQFVGDAVVAVFGAPLPNARHAHDAITAAFACQRAVEQLSGTVNLPLDLELRIRIGITTGDLLIGNVGSKKRMSYSAIGDNINLAARLEGTNKIYGTDILCDLATAVLAGPDIRFRDIDVVRVKGRKNVTRVLQPLTAVDRSDAPLDETALAGFHSAVRAFRNADFAAARDRFRGFAEHDSVSRHYLDRIEPLLQDPPGPDWDFVTTLTSK